MNGFGYGAAVHLHDALICYNSTIVMSAEVLGKELLGELKEEGLDEVCRVPKAIVSKGEASLLDYNYSDHTNESS